MSGLNLNDLTGLILEVSARHPKVTDVSDLVELVVKNTPKDRVLEFYSIAVRPMVQQVLREASNRALESVIEENPEPVPPYYRDNDNRQGGGARSKARKPHRPTTWWGELLVSRWPTRDGWKVLGSCTAEDLQYSIDQRVRHIENTQRSVDRIQALIDAMSSQGVATVGELAEDTFSKEELAVLV